MSAPQLSTTYMGLDLVSPVVASAGPFNRRLDKLIEIEASGAGRPAQPLRRGDRGGGAGRRLRA